MLSPEAKQRLEQQLQSYEQGTTRQIVVAIFPSLEGEDRFDFSMQVADKWKIGGKKNDDGVLITLFPQDRKDQILVGYGLEGQLTDLQTARIRTELMEPRFKEGDWEGGLRAGLAAIDTATGGHEHDEGKLPARSGGAEGGGGVPVGLIIFAIIVIIVIAARSRGGGGWGGGGGYWIGGGSGWSGGSGGWGGGGGGGGFSGGGGSFGGGGSGGSW